MQITYHDAATSANAADGLAIARRLVALGVPVFCAYPDEDKPCGYRLPGAWQTTSANPAYVGAWRPGMALCAVMGYTFDVLDIDPQRGQ